MKNLKLRILCYAVAVCNLLLAAVFYLKLPDRIPMHWAMDGTVTYHPRHELFLMCGMGLLFALLFDLLPRIDPRRGNYQRFGTYYDGFCVVIQFFLLSMTAVILTESFRPGSVSVSTVVRLGVGLLLIFIGNMMPKFKSNFYCGIKTPWTLSSEEVWRKTHRLGGKCFFAAGLVMALSILLPAPRTAFNLSIAAVLLAALAPGVMSYVWWRREAGKAK